MTSAKTSRSYELSKREIKVSEQGELGADLLLLVIKQEIRAGLVSPTILWGSYNENWSTRPNVGKWEVSITRGNPTPGKRRADSPIAGSTHCVQRSMSNYSKVAVFAENLPA
jgi:hypothetical protein